MLRKLLGLRPPVQALTPEQAHDAASKGSLQIVDVRTAAEWQDTGTPQGATRLTLADVGTLSPTSPIAFTCLHGPRATSAAKQIAKAHGTQVYVIQGGINAWRNAGLPIDRG